MSLAEHLHIGTPLIWITTDEPERMVDYITLGGRRDIYRIDPFKGLVKYDGTKWRRVLVVLEGEQTVTYDFQVAMGEVVENKGLFIIENAHQVAEKLLPILSGAYSQYRGAFFDNDADELPFQLVMLSCNDEIPPEIARHIAVISPGLPEAEELAGIATHIAQSVEDRDVLGDEADLTKLARAGLGFTEAEFIQVCLLSLRENERLDAPYIEKTKKDKFKHGGILEVRKPLVDFDDIGGLDNAKAIVADTVWAWENPEEAKEFEVVPQCRFLLVGVPGTGKSRICEATAKTLGYDLAKFGISQAMSKWIGESERQIRASFAQLRALAPIVAWMDELGRDLSGSGSSNDAGTTDRVHGEFLTGIQELPRNILLMAAANNISGLPPEMLRAGRFDTIMFVGFPTYEERIEIFKIHLGERYPEFDLDILAGATPVWTGAEIERCIQETKSRIGRPQRRLIETKDLIAHIPNFKNRVWIKYHGQMAAMYERALEELEWASTGQRAEAEDVLAGRAGLTKAKSQGSLITRW